MEIMHYKHLPEMEFRRMSKSIRQKYIATQRYNLKYKHNIHDERLLYVVGTEYQDRVVNSYLYALKEYILYLCNNNNNSTQDIK